MRCVLFCSYTVLYSDSSAPKAASLLGNLNEYMNIQNIHMRLKRIVFILSLSFSNFDIYSKVLHSKNEGPAVHIVGACSRVCHSLKCHLTHCYEFMCFGKTSHEIDVVSQRSTQS